MGRPPWMSCIFMSRAQSLYWRGREDLGGETRKCKLFSCRFGCHKMAVPLCRRADRHRLHCTVRVCTLEGGRSHSRKFWWGVQRPSGLDVGAGWLPAGLVTGGSAVEELWQPEARPSCRDVVRLGRLPLAPAPCTARPPLLLAESRDCLLSQPSGEDETASQRALAHWALCLPAAGNGARSRWLVCSQLLGLLSRSFLGGSAGQAQSILCQHRA